MRSLLISAFSKPTKPAGQWVVFLKSLGINSVFLNPKDLNAKTLTLLADHRIRTFLEFGVFSNDPLLWKKIPGARVVDKNGKPLTNLTFGRVPICPNNPKVRSIKLEVLDKITKKFSLDGIFLDGLRFPSAWERKMPEKIQTCFCQNCQGLFVRSNRIKIPPHASPDWPLRLYPKKWYQWRANQLVKFLKEAKIKISRNNHRAKLGIFVVPFTRKEFGNCLIKILGQDIFALSKYADIVSPMLYHRMCARKPSWIEKRVKYFSRLTKKPILPAIQTRDLPESLPNRITGEEFKTTVRLALSPPSKGVILFTLDSALSIFGADSIRKIIQDSSDKSNNPSGVV